MDNRWDCLEDVRQFLEWQKLCGTDVWMVENDQAWNPKKFVSKLPKAQFNKISERAVPQKQAHTIEPLRRKVVEETARFEEKPTEALSGKWGKVIKERAPKIDFTILNEQTGIKMMPDGIKVLKHPKMGNELLLEGRQSHDNLVNLKRNLMKN